MTDIDAVALSPETIGEVRLKDVLNAAREVSASSIDAADVRAAYQDPVKGSRLFQALGWLDHAIDAYDRLMASDATLGARADRDGLREAALELLYALDGLGPMGIRNAKHALHAALTAEAGPRE